MPNHTIVRPAKHLFEDETLLVVFIENRFRINEDVHDVPFIEKMHIKQWRLWSSFETALGRYLFFLKHVIAKR